jgi:hypothetical protein
MVHTLLNKIRLGCRFVISFTRTSPLALLSFTMKHAQTSPGRPGITIGICPYLMSSSRLCLLWCWVFLNKMSPQTFVQRLVFKSIMYIYLKILKILIWLIK